MNLATASRVHLLEQLGVDAINPRQAAPADIHLLFDEIVHDLFQAAQVNRKQVINEVEIAHLVLLLHLAQFLHDAFWRALAVGAADDALETEGAVVGAAAAGKHRDHLLAIGRVERVFVQLE